MDKAKILANKLVREVMNERLIMADLLPDPCDFIVNINSAFQNTYKLFLVLDYIEGKDLSHYIKNNRPFTEPQISTCILITEFIVICLLKTLNYLRKKNIIHQDIKPDNILIDNHGYPKLIDFSMATYWNKKNEGQNGGTPSYMAPELLFNQAHSYSVDYYALGVTVFELFFKKLPY
jgi:serine/threonine protein kinase